MKDLNQKNIKVNMNYLNEQVHHSDYSLKELISGALPLKLLDQDIVNKSYRLELVELLSINDLYRLAKEVLNLERKLKKLEKMIGVDIHIPALKSFYESLSPVMIQALAEVSDSRDRDDVEVVWLEAVRIAIEEEMASWQEK